MIYKFKEKEFKLVPKTRKVVDLTEKLKTKNLNDLIFSALNDVDIKVLAEIIKAFAEDMGGKNIINTLNDAYDFIDSWKEENQKSYKDLFKEIAEVVNEMGFFKEKMSTEELNSMIENPVPVLNLQELMKNSAQKMVDTIAEEEFKGYKA